MNENDVIRKLNCGESVSYKEILTIIKMLKEAAENWKKEYEQLANDIINGKYGTKDTTPTRKEQVEKAGFNYDIAQIFVNNLLGE